MNVQELFTAVPLAANSTTTLFTGAGAIGGFLCTTAGNVEIRDASDNVLVASVALTAGNSIPAPFALGNGCKIVLTGGCAGTAAVQPA